MPLLLIPVTDQQQGEAGFGGAGFMLLKVPFTQTQPPLGKAPVGVTPHNPPTTVPALLMPNGTVVPETLYGYVLHLSGRDNQSSSPRSVIPNETVKDRIAATADHLGRKPTKSPRSFTPRMAVVTLPGTINSI